MDLQQLERAVISASQGSSESAVWLDAARRQSPDGLARECLHLLSLRGWSGEQRTSTEQFDSVAFYALSTIQRSPILQCNNQSGDANFVSLRHQLKQNLLCTISSTCLRVMPSFIATKVGVLLALLVREEYPRFWPNPVLDVMAALRLAGDSGGHQDKHSYLMHLCFLDALSDEIVYPSVAEDSSNGNLQAQRDRREQVKDAMRGFVKTANTSTDHTKPSISVERTEAAAIARWLSETLAQTSNSNSDEVLEIAVKTAATLKRYVSWIELSLASNAGLVSLLYSGLGHASPGISDDDEMPTHRTLLSVECSMCLREITVRGMDDEKKLSLLIQLNLFPLLSQMTNSQTNVESKLIDCRLDFSDVDATQVEALAATAELTNSAGLELIQGWENDPIPASRHMEHCLEMAMLCLAYDSIDVSGPVIELIARCLNSIEKKETIWNTSFGGSNGETVCDKIISRVLAIVGTRMAYPSDFRFDYEDEEESEEEMYRAQLRKQLFVRIVRLRKTAVEAFMGVSLSALPQPLSRAQTSDIEVALRLVYHYAEGRRPPPGAKTALKQDVSFREIIIALHQSDVTGHPHREVLLLYYDIAVRYATVLKDSPDLLTRLLGALSGEHGLQHSHERVRSRCCYLLLRLVKSVGAEVMRPHVEPIVDGIQILLFPQAHSSKPASIPPNDALYLFEVTGILLGQSGLDVDVQVRSATAVLTPHVQSIEQTLQDPNLTSDVEAFGEPLSISLLAIAQLSKGWQKNPPGELQRVLTAAMAVCRNVIVALPMSPLVRNSTSVLLQRMILSLGHLVLEFLPGFLAPLISHCTLEEDVLDCSQLMNQTCIKFKDGACPAIDSSVVVFLRKVLAIQLHDADGTSTSDSLPPHLLTEQLSIRKQAFSTLHHIVTNKATAVLYSDANIGSLNDVLKLMVDGAVTVPDPVMSKTCSQFFVALIDQWSNEAAPRHVCDTFFDLVYTEFLPGMMQRILDNSFNLKDANQNRVFKEVCRGIWLLKQSNRQSEFHARFLSGLGSTNAVQNASSSKDIEACFMQWKQELGR